MRLISLLVLSLVFTILFPSALLFVLPGETGELLVWLGLLIPLLWAVVMLYCYWDEKAMRPLVVLSIMCVISVSVIFTSNPL